MPNVSQVGRIGHRVLNGLQVMLPRFDVPSFTTFGWRSAVSVCAGHSARLLTIDSPASDAGREHELGGGSGAWELYGFAASAKIVKLLKRHSWVTPDKSWAPLSCHDGGRCESRCPASVRWTAHTVQTCAPKQASAKEAGIIRRRALLKGLEPPCELAW